MANQNQNGQERKFYTFISLTRSIDKNGNPFIGITVHGPVRKPDEQMGQTNSGLSTYHFTMPIQNRGQYISTMATALTGQQVTPDETDDGTILARVTMFGKTAERFVAFREKHPYADVCVVGALSTRPWNDNQGGAHTAVDITANDFFLVRELQPPKSQQGGYVPQAQTSQQGGWPQQGQAPAPQAPVPQQGGWPQQQGQAPAPQAPVPQQQGGWPQQGQAPAPQAPVPQQGGWPQQGQAPVPPAPQAPAQMSAPVQPDGSGFFDLSADDGELPF